MAYTADLYLDDIKSLIQETTNSLDECETGSAVGYNNFCSIVIGLFVIVNLTTLPIDVLGLAFSSTSMNYDSAEDQMSTFLEDLYDIRFAIQSGSYTAVRMGISTTIVRGYTFINDWEILKVGLSTGKWIND